MSARLKGRRREVAAMCQRLIAWARERAEVRAIMIVGSYARGTPRLGSDLDVMLLVDDPARYIETDAWITEIAPTARPLRRWQWGPVTERRARLASGLHLDLGITTPSWAHTPLDPGTATVLRDGAQALHDPHGLAAHAIEATHRTGREGPGDLQS